MNRYTPNTHTHTHTHTHTRSHIHTHTHTQYYIHTQAHTHTHTHTHTYRDIGTQTCTHRHKETQTDWQTDTYIHTWTQNYTSNRNLYLVELCSLYCKGTSIRQAPVFRHLRVLLESPWKFIIWMNEFYYIACCWFPISSNILILPSQFWQIRFESYWLHCSKCRILVFLRYIITGREVMWQKYHTSMVYSFWKVSLVEIYNS